MSTTVVPIDYSSIPGVTFETASAPAVVQTVTDEAQRNIDQMNATRKAQFFNACNDWLKKADPTVPKPVSQPSIVLMVSPLTTDQYGRSGVWVWQADGRAYGVCPDLPVIPASTGPAVQGLIPAGTAQPMTIDAKLDELRDDMKALLAHFGLTV